MQSGKLRGWMREIGLVSDNFMQHSLCLSTVLFDDNGETSRAGGL
jgi:hypothetical protein